MSKTATSLYEQAVRSEREKRLKALDVAQAVAYALERDPDAVRAALGSTGFRDAETFAALARKAEADFQEWAHV